VEVARKEDTSSVEAVMVEPRREDTYRDWPFIVDAYVVDVIIVLP